MSLSIGGDYAAQRLQSLFAQMSATQTASTDTMSSSTDSTSSTAAPDNCLTGSSQAQLSDDILSTLIQLQGGSSTSTASGTATDPAQSLFSAMDTNGDGSVSQTEMESYLESNGATQSQADAVYSALNTDGSSSGISESQLASAAQQAGGPGGAGGMHHHHHHHAQASDGSNGDSNPLDQLMSLIGGSGTSDGSISQDAFSSFVTSNGGTASEASSDFAALDTDGSGTLTSADFAATWQNAQTGSGASAFVTSMLDAFAKANTATSSAAAAGSTTSISA